MIRGVPGCSAVFRCSCILCSGVPGITTCPVQQHSSVQVGVKIGHYVCLFVRLFFVCLFVLIWTDGK